MTASNLQLESSTLPPAQPSYILRGHTAQIHVLHFFHQNLNLLSGDAEGWIVLWDLPIKRPTAVWRAHDATVLGLGTWGDDVVITFALSEHSPTMCDVLTRLTDTVETTNYLSGNSNPNTRNSTQLHYRSRMLRQRGRNLGSYIAFPSMH